MDDRAVKLRRQHSPPRDNKFAPGDHGIDLFLGDARNRDEDKNLIRGFQDVRGRFQVGRAVEVSRGKISRRICSARESMSNASDHIQFREPRMVSSFSRAAANPAGAPF